MQSYSAIVKCPKHECEHSEAQGCLICRTAPVEDVDLFVSYMRAKTGADDETDLVPRMTALAERATADCAKAVQRTYATRALLDRAFFGAMTDVGESSWPRASRPMLRLVSGGAQ